MGCCISTGKDPHHMDLPKPSPQPPPLPVEEETVKEVLVHSVSVSETPPISKPLQSDTLTQTQIPNNTHHYQDKKPQLRDEEKTPELSQASEICSISQSFSTATTATTATTTTTAAAEKRGDDEAVSKPQRASRSPRTARGRRPYSGGVGKERVSRSPAGRAEQSPQGKRGQAGPRLVQGRESGHVGTRRRNVGPAAVRRGDSQEGTARRSKSPATRNAGSLRQDGAGAAARRSPAKAKGITGDSRSADVATESGGGVKKEEESNDGVSVPGTETLDNPLVSLECFIFL